MGAAVGHDPCLFFGEKWDVWALGFTLFYVITGCGHPWDATESEVESRFRPQSGRDEKEQMEAKGDLAIKLGLQVRRGTDGGGGTGGGLE